jgi:carboxyl-terminal processing protease
VKSAENIILKLNKSLFAAPQQCCAAIYSLLVTLVLSVVPLGAAEKEPVAPFPDMGPALAKVLRQEYYDPQRYDPTLMVRRGLRSLAAADDTIAASLTAGALSLSLGDQDMVLDVPALNNLADAMQVLEEVRLTLAFGGFDDNERRDLAYAMFNGALMVGDPHTLIFPPEPASDFEDQIQGNFFGIGAWLQQEEGITRIDRVMPGLPADRAGVHDGDVILAVDGENTVGLTISQVVKRIKGPRGTNVGLRMERSGEDDPVLIEVTRDAIPIPQMRRHLAGNVGYIRMDDFNHRTADELAGNIRALANASINGLVLDLRFNSGGLLSQAIAICDAFLPAGVPIVSTSSLRGQTSPRTAGTRVRYDGPLLVLVGPGSASAAEILAGALQMSGRALVIGQTTYGKGSVQTIKELPDGSKLKYTIQEYLLWESRSVPFAPTSIQERGVIPDILLLEHQQDEDKRVDMSPFPALREEDNENVLHATRLKQASASFSLPWLRYYRTRDQMREHQLGAKQFSPDQEGALAIDLLTRALAQPLDGHLQRMGDKLRIALEPVLVAIEEEQAKAMQEALSAYDESLTWGNDRQPVEGSLSLSVDGTMSANAGETVQLTVTVHSNDKAPIGRLFGVVAGDRASPFWKDEVIFGQVEAGGTRAAALQLTIPPRMPSGDELFQIDLYQDGDPRVWATVPVRLSITGQPRPHLGYKLTLHEEDNEDGIIALDENVVLALTPVNTGKGATADIVGYAGKKDDFFLHLGEGRFQQGSIAPESDGEAFLVPLRVKSQVQGAKELKTFDDDHATIRWRMGERFEEGTDGRFGAILIHDLSIPLGKPFEPQSSTLSAPRVELVNIEHEAGQNVAQITVSVTDDNLERLAVFVGEVLEEKRLRSLRLVGEDKIMILPATQLSPETTLTVPVQPGLNVVRLEATDRDELTNIVPIRFFLPVDDDLLIGQVAPAAAHAAELVP